MGAYEGRKKKRRRRYRRLRKKAHKLELKIIIEEEKTKIMKIKEDKGR